MLFVHEAHPDADETLLFLQGGNVAGWTWYDLAASLSDHHSLIPDQSRVREVERRTLDDRRRGGGLGRGDHPMRVRARDVEIDAVAAV